jgi:hypothetical protein
MATKKVDIQIWDKAKGWWRSTTVWVNLVPVIILVIEYVTKTYVIDPDVVAILTAIANILNRIRAPQSVQPLKLI